jgi:hypothetical protein
MTITAEVLLYAIAVILLVLAALGLGTRVALGWLGLALAVFTFGVLRFLTRTHIGQFPHPYTIRHLPTSVFTHSGAR